MQVLGITCEICILFKDKLLLQIKFMFDSLSDLKLILISLSIKHEYSDKIEE